MTSSTSTIQFCVILFYTKIIRSKRYKSQSLKNLFARRIIRKSASASLISKFESCLSILKCLTKEPSCKTNCWQPIYKKYETTCIIQKNCYRLVMYLQCNFTKILAWIRNKLSCIIYNCTFLIAGMNETFCT